MSDGLLLVDKPSGMTSHDVVQRVRAVLRQKKVGHCGTLDPAATGLLVLTVGKATRLTRFLIRAPKVYEGTVRFGQETDTYDADGEVVRERPIDDLDTETIRRTMSGFVGEYDHLTPPYSARKVQGVKSYELARRGEEVPVERKQVRIFAYDLLGELGDDGRIAFRLSCASGTYARGLAHELGQILDTGAHLDSLRRLTVGGFQLQDAGTLAEIEAVTGDPVEAEALPGWIPFDGIPLPFESIEVDSQQERRLSHGQTALVRGLESGEGDWIRIETRRGAFLAVASVVEQIGADVGVLQPRIVFK